jgi:hypothetical protein
MRSASPEAIRKRREPPIFCVLPESTSWPRRREGFRFVGHRGFVSRPSLQVYGDDEDDELEMTIVVMPPEKDINLNSFGFINIGLRCHLTALLACLLNIAPFARAICEGLSASW